MRVRSVIYLKEKFARTTALRRWVVVVCLLLISISVVAQSHFHTDDSTSVPKHCPICQVAHSTSAQITVVAQCHVIYATCGYLILARDHDHLLDLYASWHFSRPPPLA